MPGPSSQHPKHESKSTPAHFANAVLVGTVIHAAAGRRHALDCSFTAEVTNRLGPLVGEYLRKASQSTGACAAACICRCIATEPTRSSTRSHASCLSFSLPYRPCPFAARIRIKGCQFKRLRVHVEELHGHFAVGIPKSPVIVGRVACGTEQLAPFLFLVILSWIQQTCVLCLTRRGCAAAEVRQAAQKCLLCCTALPRQSEPLPLPSPDLRPS